jgi:EXS family
VTSKSKSELFIPVYIYQGMSSTQEAGDIFGGGAGPAHAMLRSPTVLIASIGLWGMNVYLFRVFGIDHVKVLQHDVLKLDDQYGEDVGAGGGVVSVSTTNATADGSTNNGGVVIHHRPQQRSRNGQITNKKTASLATSEDVQQQSDDEEVAIMGIDSALLSVDDSYYDDVTAGRLIGLSITLLLLLHATYVAWIDYLGGGSIGAIFAFFAAVTTAILFPLQSTRWLRLATRIVFNRAFELIRPRCHCLRRTQLEENGTTVKPPRPIPFVDVFFADAMCSLSKVFFDWGMLLHMASYYPNPVPATAWNILIPSSFAAVPYLIRTRQCLIMWRVSSLKGDPGRYQHLWNALKYSTSIFPLILSAYQKTIMVDRSADLEVFLIVLLIINAGYALWWDIGMCFVCVWRYWFARDCIC